MRKYVTLTFLCLGVVWFSPAGAQDLNKVKALFISKFVEYMQWPNMREVKIGVMGNAGILPTLETAASKKSFISEAVEVASFGELRTINLLYVGQKASGQFQNILKATKGTNIVIVCDRSDLISKGADMSFYVKDGKLRFYMNQGSIEEKVKVSASLLLLATIVER